MLVEYTAITEDNLIEAITILENNITAKIGFNISKFIKEKEKEERKDVIF